MAFRSNFSMQVEKRDGRREEVSFDKVLERIRRASEGLSVNPTALSQKILAQIYDGVKTSELDELTSQLAASLATVHPDYGALAARITISNHQKNTDSSFTNVVLALGNQTAPKTGERVSYVSEDLINIVNTHGAEIDAYINHNRDYLFDYFGFKTLERAYLLKDTSGRVLERPQHMWMRVALGIWGDDLKRAFETYDLMSQKYFTHATPTLFNAGTKHPQLSSCYLIAMDSDSINGIYKTLGDCAQISKFAGGIGMHCHNIRAKGSIIRGTNGTSNGLVPMLRVFNSTARYVDQCFTPDTKVVTRDGIKLICNVSTDDEVLTSGCIESADETGKHYVKPDISDVYCKVAKRVEHVYTGEMYTVTTDKGETVQVTPKHPFLAFLPNGELDYCDVETLSIGWRLLYKDNTFTTITKIEITKVENKTLYDLEIDGTHDYTIYNVGIAHNGGGRRNGSFAIYLEPWHADVEDFLRLKLNTGSEEERARDLFYAMWISDLFMKRVEEDGDWSLFCPSEAPGLADVHSAEFEALYTRYEKEGRGRKTIKAQKLWFQILDTQMETGTPYLLYKDPANAKSNQQNLGTIKSSNLCVAPETLILTDRGHIKIEDLAGQEVTVWNGTEWSKTTVMKTGENQDILGVDVLDIVQQENGAYVTSMKHIECTPYHKFILNSNRSLAESERIDAKDLKQGMVLRSWMDVDGTIHEHMVWGVYDYKRKSDTYCFNEPRNHAGIFNGVCLGNCTEIIEYSSESESAVCNLASIGLPTFVDQTTNTFDFVKLREVVAVATRNLNRVIDINYYPTPETRKSNMRHRPIGLGVQGLADVFAMMRLPWDSDGAADLNQRIFEHIYFAAIEESMRIAAFDESPYETFKGSPASKGKLQPDLWNVIPLTEQDGTLGWKILRENVVKYGLRNSLLVAPMPTASTSQILGYNECFEPFTSNLYTRRTLAGEYIVVNKYLLKDLIDRGLWNEDLKQMIIARNGSIQNIYGMPQDLQDLYKTAWELKQRTLIDHAAARGAFICQSQSLNLFVADPSYAKLTSMHFYAWKKGLKTGCYYLRTKAAVMAQKFTVDPKFLSTIAVSSTHSAPSKQISDPSSLTRSETRAERLERLAKEYEEEQKRANDAAANGEGCLMCSG